MSETKQTNIEELKSRVATLEKTVSDLVKIIYPDDDTPEKIEKSMGLSKQKDNVKEMILNVCYMLGGIKYFDHFRKHLSGEKYTGEEKLLSDNDKIMFDMADALLERDHKVYDKFLEKISRIYYYQVFKAIKMYMEGHDDEALTLLLVASEKCTPAYIVAGRMILSDPDPNYDRAAILFMDYKIKSTHMTYDISLAPEFTLCFSKPLDESIYRYAINTGLSDSPIIKNNPGVLALKLEDLDDRVDDMVRDTERKFYEKCQQHDY